jgi:hypothetical protein
MKFNQYTNLMYVTNRAREIVYGGLTIEKDLEKIIEK